MERFDPGSSRRPARPCCEHCGDLIGVYEPCVVRGAEGWRMTSLAAEPELLEAELVCRHARCLPSALDDLG